MTGLEDVASNIYISRAPPHPVVQETNHPCIEDVNMSGHVRTPGAESLRTAKSNDPLGTHFISNKDLNNDDTNISSE